MPFNYIWEYKDYKIISAKSDSFTAPHIEVFKSIKAADGEYHNCLLMYFHWYDEKLNQGSIHFIDSKPFELIEDEDLVLVFNALHDACSKLQKWQNGKIAPFATSI